MDVEPKGRVVAGHRRDDDAELIAFVAGLSERRRPAPRRSLRPRIPPPGPGRWRLAFVAVAAAVFAMGAGIALAATAAPPPAAGNVVDCTLVVPAHPLTAAGLATPYRLLAPCHESDSGMSAFVQATVLDPATGQLSVYDPLVVDADAKPAAPPVVPRLPEGAVVGIWFGFNGDNLTLQAAAGSNLSAAQCVNGVPGSIFGQYAYCAAPAFFTMANAAIAGGKLTVPPIGAAKDGLPCPTTRDFGLVDQDQSDNVTTTYLFLPGGSTAQNTAANQAALAAKGAQVQVNGSDEGLLDNFVMPALGCTPFTAPDLADNGHPVTALALNELQAAAHQGAPVALVPTSDPMTLVNGKADVTKTNLYRTGVDQGPLDQATETQAEYCRNLVDVGVNRTDLDRRLTSAVKTPDPAAATTLFTFLAQRLSGSFDQLGCAKLLQITNPVILVTDKNGVTTDARFVRPSPSASPSPSGSPSRSATPSAPAAPSASPSRPAPPTVTAAPTPSSAAPTPPPAASPTPTQPAMVRPTTASPTPPPPAVAAPPAPPSNPPAAPPAGGGGGGGQPVAAKPIATAPTTGSRSAAAAPAAPSPAPTLTLGPMPAKQIHPAGSAGSSMPPARLAGTVLLSGGGLVAVTIVIRGLLSARRRRYRFAGL
jgi:hypothetical protein